MQAPVEEVHVERAREAEPIFRAGLHPRRPPVVVRYRALERERAGVVCQLLERYQVVQKLGQNVLADDHVGDEEADEVRVAVPPTGSHATATVPPRRDMGTKGRPQTNLTRRQKLPDIYLHRPRDIPLGGPEDVYCVSPVDPSPGEGLFLN